MTESTKSGIRTLLNVLSAIINAVLTTFFVSSCTGIV